MKNCVLIGITAAILIGAIYCAFQAFPASQQNGKLDIADVTLAVNAAFSRATIVIENSGNIIYEASSPQTGIESQTTAEQIPEAEFLELTDLINKNNFWAFNEIYWEEGLMDATTYTVTVNWLASDGQTKTYSVTCYGECPEKIVEIIGKIKELWGREIMEIGV